MRNMNDFPENIEPRAPVAEPTATPDGPRFPKIRVKLVGEDGNAFAILGRVKAALRKGGASAEEQKAFIEEAMKGDYNNLLATCCRWVDVR